MANDFTKTAGSDIAMDVAMGVTDPAAIATDVMLDELIDSLVSHYANAASDVENKTSEYFKKFKDEDEKKLTEVKSGKLKKSDYTKWRAQKMLTGDNYKKLQEVLTSDMTNSNQIAADIINHKKSDIYALNHNYGIYEIEHSTGLATSYVLYDHNTVEHLIADNPKLLPKNKINIPADKKWNAQKINNAITQGVLQGEPIPDIAKRLRGVTDMNKNAAIRNARTATTGAQNAGREQSYERAEKMGIDMLQVWVSTIDGRTRHSHRTLMGEKAKVGKKFSNGLYFPGDPDGPGREVYNCRCTVMAEVNGFDHGIKEMVDAKLKEKGMTWDEWVDEQPLPKKTGETKAQYLARYSQLKKKQSFDEWLGMQAAPDEAIVDLWANKGWSKVFYEIYDKDHAAANAFKKELTALGDTKGIKPKEIWDQYLKGELDAEDFNKFENILRKHLGDVPDTVDDLSDYEKFLKKWENVDISNNELPTDAYSHLWDARGNKTVKEYWNAYLKGEINDPDLDKMLGYKGTKPKPVPKPEPTPIPKSEPKVEPKIEPISEPKPVVKPDITEDMSDKAKEAASKITHQKGEPMDMAKADNHNTNPLYNKNYADSKINCQTCALTYEARRQGYDVIALPRNLNKNIEKLQNELARNTRKAWIKKDTGGMVQPIFKDKKGTGKSLHDLLDKKVGTNGERYCIDFGWKNTHGGHIINLDRDENGVLRLIDNQRGIGEKQIWVGEKEIVQYLDRVENLQLYRVDDCIPNPKFFNKVCVKSSDIKSTKTFEKLGFDNAEKISNLLDLDMDDAKEYYNAWRVGLKKNKKLDNFMDSIKDTSNVAEVVDKKTIDIMGKKFTKSDLMFIKDDDELWDILSNKYSEDWLEKFDGPDFKKKVLDEIFEEKSKPINVVDFKKSLPKDFYDLDDFDLFSDIEVYLDKKPGSSSAYWYKYRLGVTDDPGLDKILQKHLNEKNIAAEVESLFGKDSMSKVYNELKALHGTSTANEFYNKILKPMGKQSDVWKKYVANELSEIDAKKIDDFLLKHIGAKAPKPVTKVDDIADIAKNKYGATDLDDLVNKLMDDDDVNNLLYKYATNNNNLDAPTTLLKKYLNGDVDIPDLDDHIKAAKTVSTVKPSVTSKTFSTWDEFIEDFKKNPDNAAWLSQNAKPSKYMNNTIMNQSAYSEYKDVKKKLKNGELTNEDYLKYVIQKYGGDEYKKLKNDPTLLKMFEGLSNDMKISGKEIYRGLNMSQSEIDKLLKGGTIDMKGISSWSLSEDKATGFALSGNKKGVLLHDASGQQHEGLNIDFAKSKYLQDEKEVLLSPDEKWEVIGSHYEHKTFTNDFGHTTEGDVLVIDVVPVQNAAKISNKIDNASNVSAPKPLTPDDDIIEKWKHVDSVFDAPPAVTGHLAGKGVMDPEDYWKKYLKGDIKDTDIDDILKKYPVKPTKTVTPKPAPVPTSDTDDLLSILNKDLSNKKWMDAWEVLEDKGISDDAIDAISHKLYLIKKDKSIATKDEVLDLYLKGKIKDSELDDLFSKAFDLDIPEKKITPTLTPSTSNIDLDALKDKKVTAVYNEIKDDIGSKDANAFYKELKDIGAKDGLKQGDVWKKYINGELDADDVAKIEKHLEKKYTKAPEKPKWSTEEENAIKNIKKSLSKNINDLSDEEFDVVDDYLMKKGLGIKNSKKYWEDYMNGDVVDYDLDKLLKKHYDEKLPDMIKDDKFDFIDPNTGEVFDKVGEFEKIKKMPVTDLDDMAKKLTEQYELDIDDAKKLLKESGLNIPETPTVDLNSLKGKKMSQVYNDIKATDTKTANQFYNELKKMGKPSEVWDQYLKGELSNEQKEIIEKHLIKKYSTSSGKNISTTPLSTAEVTKLEKEIKSAEKELEKFSNKTYKIDVSAGAEDVSASDYKIYKDDLKKKKDFYNETIDDLMNLKPGDPDYWKIQMLSEEQKLQQIEKYKKILKDIDDFEKDGKKYLELQEKISKNKDKLNAASAGEQAKKLEEAKKELDAAEKALKDNVDVNTKWHGIWKEDVTVEDYPIKKSTIAAKKVYYEDELDKLENDPNYKSWLSEEAKNDKIMEMETYLEDLDEFEELGKKYEKYKTAVDKARDKVNAATPVGEAYTETRKNNAKWFHNKDYYKGDTYYDKWSRPIHNNATTMEKRAYKDYTSASGGFNRPLAGFQAPQYSGASGWNPSNFKGVGKVNIDNEGKGKKIKDLTKFIEKSKTPDDIWIQTAQNFATLEGPGGKGFLPGVNYGDLAKMSDTDLQQFVGVESKFGQFISGSINRGGGSYTPGDVRINIYCPQGSEALYVLEDGTFGKSEHEIILQRGGTYRVSKIYWGTDAEKGGRKLMVDLELRLEKGYDKYI